MSKEIDMCNGPIVGKLLVFAFPLMCSSVLQLLFNAADTIVVGRFAGPDSLAAVGSTASLIQLITNMFVGLSAYSRCKPCSTARKKPRMSRQNRPVMRNVRSCMRPLECKRGTESRGPSAPKSGSWKRMRRDATGGH